MDLDSTQDHASSSPVVMTVMAETTQRESHSSQNMAPQGDSEMPLASASVSAEAVSTASSQEVGVRPVKAVAVVSSAPFPPQQLPMPSGYSVSQVGGSPQPSAMEVEMESVTVREASSEEGTRSAGDQAKTESTGTTFADIFSNVSSEAEMRSGGSMVILNEPLIDDKGVAVDDSKADDRSGSVSESRQLSTAGPNLADSSEERHASISPTLSHSLEIADLNVGVAEPAKDVKEAEMEEAEMEEAEMMEAEMMSEGGEMEETGDEAVAEDRGNAESRQNVHQEEATMEYADTTHTEGIGCRQPACVMCRVVSTMLKRGRSA